MKRLERERLVRSLPLEFLFRGISCIAPRLPFLAAEPRRPRFAGDTYSTERKLFTLTVFVKPPNHLFTNKLQKSS